MHPTRCRGAHSPVSLHPFAALVLRSVTYATLQLQVPHAQRTRYGLSHLQNPASRCLAETTCTGEKAQRRKEMIMVTDFGLRSFLHRREQAYTWTKLMSDPTFNGSRCTVESDREIVEKRILESGFASVHDFDVYIKEVADDQMSPFREVSHHDAQHATAPQSCPASACDSVC